MSQEERDRLEWLKRAKDGVVSQCEAATRMGVTDRWVRKLLKRMKWHSDRVVVHGLRRRASNRRIAKSGARSGDRVAEAAGLARLRTDVRQRASRETARHRGER
jgi:Homeodomain-like domain-containing protein